MADKGKSAPKARPASAISGHPAKPLRRRAEASLREKSVQSPQGSDGQLLQESQRVLQELQVHQVELELQNEEMLRIQVEIAVLRDRYYELFDLAPVGYCILSDKGVILEANHTAALLLGYPRGALPGRRLSGCIVAEDQKTYSRHHRLLLQTGEAQACDLRMIPRGGETFWAHLEARAVRNEDETVLCRLAISDISALKQAEELHRARDSALAADEAKTNLLHTVVHELRSPLSLLHSSLDILERYGDGLDDAQRQDQKSRVFSAVSQLKILIDNLSCSAQITAGQVSQPGQAMPLGILVASIADEMRSVWRDSHELLVTMDPACEALLVDATLLRRILGNLLTNAFHYSPDGGGVVLRVQGNSQRIVLVIADHGIGISAEDQQTIFEPFCRGRNIGARRGMGMGLSIVRDAVRQLKGTITLASALGSGTSVRVNLPQREQETSCPPLSPP